MQTDRFGAAGIRPQTRLSALSRAAILGIVTAYWINTFVEISDEGKLARYVELAGPAMRAAGGRFLARGEPAFALEEAGGLRVTLIEFPSVEAARAAYDSDGYRAALAALGDGARREIRIVDGIPGSGRGGGPR
jgi:uncharacterized protein (DUF1330 family)